MLQLVYISSAVGKPDVGAILAVSRRNNARDDVTGLLYADGVRFLQALEGPADKVEAAFARIGADPRHRAVVVLSRRTVETHRARPHPNLGVRTRAELVQFALQRPLIAT